MLKSRLCDYSDADILIKGTIIFSNAAGADAAANDANKNLIFKNYAQFPDCISEMNNAHVGNVKNIDAVTSVYNLIEASDNYLKTPESLWQYYRDKPDLADAGAINHFLLRVFRLNLSKK